MTGVTGVGVVASVSVLVAVSLLGGVSLLVSVRVLVVVGLVALLVAMRGGTVISRGLRSRVMRMSLRDMLVTVHAYFNRHTPGGYSGTEGIGRLTR